MHTAGWGRGQTMCTFVHDFGRKSALRGTQVVTKWDSPASSVTLYGKKVLHGRGQRMCRSSLTEHPPPCLLGVTVEKRVQEIFCQLPVQNCAVTHTGSFPAQGFIWCQWGGGRTPSSSIYRQGELAFLTVQGFLYQHTSGLVCCSAGGFDVIGIIGACRSTNV